MEKEADQINFLFIHLQIVHVPSIDVLLSRGICDYTLLPKTLGRGKFSTVFMASKNGELSAIKHTALFPHHQLISTRLLREPTLLAELPPHPNLVAVKETIRTPGHFYLVEEYLGGYVTLEALVSMLGEGQPAILPAPAAEKVLTQLLSAVHAIHVPLQICHRDIKPENILVHPESLQLKLLDFGLATHYSKSEPKLSTCCGSPAFHCPEIVKALASPPGSVMYMGPEVDAWTCGVTMLRCLTGQRFPLGASHSSMRGMAIRAQRAVASIADEGLRAKVGALLDMDGNKRMRKFEELVAEQEREQGEPSREGKRFKSTTFIPVEPTHSIKLPLLAPHLTVDAGLPSTSGFPSPTLPASASRRTTPASSRPPSPIRSRSMTPVPPPKSHSANIVALNPTHQPPERILSYIKYCLRCAGILYHTWPDSSGHRKTNSGSPVNYFTSQPSTPHPTFTLESANTGFAEALAMSHEVGSSSSSSHQPGLSPVTPLFPSFHQHDDKTEALAHVQVFQCVVEVLEEEDRDQGAEQMSLVQSIMAAFGRKKPLAPTSPRPDNKRSLSTPARVRNGNLAAPASSLAGKTSSKDAATKCLSFHLIIRFPRVSNAHHTNSTRLVPSRNASSLSLSQQVASNSFASHTRHARALSGGTTLPSREVVVEVDESLKPQEAEFANLIISTDNLLQGSSTQHSQSRSTSNRSPSSSRPPSRTRKRSHRGPPKKPKVLIQLTDYRAEQIIRDALSVGGTINSLEDDYFSTNHHNRHQLPSSASVDVGLIPSALSESSEPLTPSRGDQKRKPRSRTVTISSSSSTGRTELSVDSTNTTPRASEESSNQTPRSFRFAGSEGEGEEELRGRQLNNLRGSTAGIRAPSHLSKVALPEESGKEDDFEQSITSLTTVLQTIMTSSQNSTPAVSPGTPSSGQSNSDPNVSSNSGGSSNTSSIPIMTAYYTGGENRAQMQARTLLVGICKRLQIAEKSGASALEDLISPLSFTLFSALTPALGLEPQETMGLPNAGVLSATVELGESTTLRGLASSALSILARSASPREMFLAVQERLEIINSTRASKAPLTEEQADGDFLQVGPSVNQRSDNWSGALELSGLMYFLGIVTPRIKTEKPSNFLQSLTTSIPRSVRSSLRAAIPFFAQDAGLSDVGTHSNSGSNPQTPSTEGSKEVGTTQSHQQWASDRIALAAGEVALSLTFLTQSLALWIESAEDKETNKARPILHNVFLASIIALMPELPKVDGYSTLAEHQFHRWYPQYSFTRPDQEGRSVKTGTEILQPKIWQSLKDTVASLKLDLEQCAFQRSKSLEVDSSSVAIRTMGAFILETNFLSRCSDQENHSPTKWSKEASWKKLKMAMPLLLASLGSGVPATISADGTHSLGGSAHLSDSALSWIIWCIQGINREKTSDVLDEAEILPILQMLSSHAALCPDPPSRLISLTLVEILLDKNSEPQMGRDVLRDLLLESPFPQLKTASVGLTKRLIASDLEKGMERYATRDLIQSISSALFTIPINAPEQPEKDVTASRAYLEDHGAWLGECLGFIYFVATRDTKNQTGLMDEQSVSLISSALLQPFENWINQIISSTTSSKEKDETRLALQCSLLGVALDRAKDALQAHSAAAAAAPLPPSPSPPTTTTP